MVQTKTIAALVGLAMTFLLSAWAQAQVPRARLTEIFVLQLGEFSTQHPPGGIYSFDLSPDGKTLAMENATREKDGTFGVWITLWSVGNRHLIAADQVERNYPTYNFDTTNKYEKAFNGTPFLGFTHKLRFSPDGHKLVVLTGPHLRVLSYPDLKPLYSVPNPVDPSSHHAQMVFTDFAISAHGDRLALLREYPRGTLRMYESGYTDLRSFEVTIVDLDDGKILAHWSMPGHSESIALSSDGALLALTLNPVAPGTGVLSQRENNVFIMSADSGEVVRALNTGSTAGDAQFLPNGTDLLTMPDDHGATVEFKRSYLQEAVRVWDLKTGRLGRELRYQKYGVRSPSHMAISANGEWLAVASTWHNPSDLTRDRDVVRGWTRLLLWDVATGQLVYESDDLGPEYRLQGEEAIQRTAFPGPLGGPVLVRESASGDRIAIGGQVVSVFSVIENRNGPAAN